MATLLSELARALSLAAARELRARADSQPLSRAEMIALATLNEVTAASLAIGPLPANTHGTSEFEFLERMAALDMAIVEQARRKPAA